MIRFFLHYLTLFRCHSGFRTTLFKQHSGTENVAVSVGKRQTQNYRQLNDIKNCNTNANFVTFVNYTQCVSSYQEIPYTCITFNSTRAFGRTTGHFITNYHTFNTNSFNSTRLAPTVPPVRPSGATRCDSNSSRGGNGRLQRAPQLRERCGVRLHCALVPTAFLRRPREKRGKSLGRRLRPHRHPPENKGAIFKKQAITQKATRGAFRHKKRLFLEFDKRWSHRIRECS